MNRDNPRAAIITVYGYHNYGNRLQNYALQTVLEKEGLEVDTLVFDHVSNTETFGEKFVRKLLGSVRFRHNYIYSKISKIWKRNKINPFTDIDKKREQIFRDFSKQYIHEKHVPSNELSHLSQLDEEYEVFVIGSDQVWNPDYISDYKINFAAFAQPFKRIAYAASIGKVKLDCRERHILRKGLQGIDNISVREERGKEIVEDLTQKACEVVLDPTFLLAKEEWLQLESAFVLPSKPYILIYFLTEIPDGIKQKITDLSEQKNFELITIGARDRTGEYLNGPAEFLQYIRNAELVCTDSFHGVAFSIIFHTPFYVFRRSDGENGMYDRIQTLLSKFGLLSCQYEKEAELDIIRKDYNEIEKRLNQEKGMALKFLRESLRRSL